MNTFHSSGFGNRELIIYSDFMPSIKSSTLAIVTTSLGAGLQIHNLLVEQIDLAPPEKHPRLADEPLATLSLPDPLAQGCDLLPPRANFPLQKVLMGPGRPVEVVLHKSLIFTSVRGSEEEVEEERCTLWPREGDGVSIVVNSLGLDGIVVFEVVMSAVERKTI